MGSVSSTSISSILGDSMGVSAPLGLERSSLWASGDLCEASEVAVSTNLSEEQKNEQDEPHYHFDSCKYNQHDSVLCMGHRHSV